MALPVVDLDETMEKGDQITDEEVIVLEIKRILLYRVFKQRSEYLVEWTGLDASFNMWIHKGPTVTRPPWSVIVVFHHTDTHIYILSLPLTLSIHNKQQL
jgi:hypothetical protein